jgi:hypothetical protein
MNPSAVAGTPAFRIDDHFHHFRCNECRMPQFQELAQFAEI